MTEKPRPTAQSPAVLPKAFELKASLRRIETILANPRNARKHSKKQIVQIARSIKLFGFLIPILVDETGMIIAGHGRLEAARQLVLEMVPVIVVSHLSEAEKRAYVLADNKIALNAGWDREMLSIELGELSVMLSEIDTDLQIGDTGFSTGELDSLSLDFQDDKADPADIVDLAEKTIVSRREYIWQLGQRKPHRLLCGDARSSENMAKLLAGEKAAEVITDPPFNVKVNGHVGGRGKTKHREFAFGSGEMTRQEFLEFLASTIKIMAESCSPGALLYIFIDWRHVEDVLFACRSLSLELRNICIWNKTTPGQGSFYRSAHEMVVVCQVPGGRATNNIELGRHGRNRTNVWTFPGVNTFKVGPDDDYALHPTVKPVALIAEAIKDASDRGGIILDAFLGSGTTLLAAEKVGRRCFGVEYEPRYVDVAIRRWQQFTGQDAVLVDADPDSRSAGLLGLTFNEVEELRREEGGL